MIADRLETDYRSNTRSGTRAASTGALLEPTPQPRPDARRQPQSGVRPNTGAKTRPMGERRAPLVVRHVRALGWRSPETLAVLVASFFVTLAAIYVGAYARIAADGVAEAKLTRQSRDAEEQKDALLARISELTLASDMQKTATQMNMVANDPKSEQLLDGAITASGVVAAPVAAVKIQP